MSKLPSNDGPSGVPPSPDSSTTSSTQYQRIPRSRARPTPSSSRRSSPEPSTATEKTRMGPITGAGSTFAAPASVAATESANTSVLSIDGVSSPDRASTVADEAERAAHGRVMESGVAVGNPAMFPDLAGAMDSGSGEVRAGGGSVHSDMDPTSIALSSGGEKDADSGGEAADAAAAIAAATAIFAMTGGGSGSTSRSQSGTNEVLEDGETKAERRSSLLRPRSAGSNGSSAASVERGLKRSVSGNLNANSRLTKSTASSAARLRVSAPPVPDFDAPGGGERATAKTSRRASES